MELWAQDEHRLGLKPVIRKVWALNVGTQCGHSMWALKGERPVATVHHRYKWTYLPLFLRAPENRGGPLAHPTHGKRQSVLSLALSHFAEQVGAGKDKRILLVLDQAGWHTSPRVRVPEGLELEFLPSHSPELQPSERLWPLTNEGVANRYFFEDIEFLEEALIERWVALCGEPEVIRSYTRYHWWSETA